MADIYVNTENYLNCCRIPHWVCSVIICAICTLLAVIAGLLAVALPDILGRIYNVGGTDNKILMCGLIISFLLLTSHGFLAIGIFMDWALFLLIWLILNILLWNLHLILFIHSIVFYDPDDKSEPYGGYRLFGLFLLQVIWLLFIVMVGQHWYAICEDLYAIQNRGRLRGSIRKLLVSNRVRL